MHNEEEGNIGSVKGFEPHLARRLLLSWVEKYHCKLSCLVRA